MHKFDRALDQFTEAYQYTIRVQESRPGVNYQVCFIEYKEKNLLLLAISQNKKSFEMIKSVLSHTNLL